MKILSFNTRVSLNLVLIIGLFLSTSTFFNLNGQQQDLLSLTKGGPYIEVDLQQQYTSNRIISPNQRYLFYFDIPTKKWTIEDRAPNGFKRDISIIPNTIPQEIVNSCHRQNLRIESNGEFKLSLHSSSPLPPNGQLFMFAFNIPNCNTLELKDDGGLVAKNTAGAVIWGPTYANPE